MINAIHLYITTEDQGFEDMEHDDQYCWCVVKDVKGS